MKPMIAADSAATGAWRTSWFHQLSAGKSGGSAPPMVAGADWARTVTPAARTSATTSSGAVRYASPWCVAKSLPSGTAEATGDLCRHFAPRAAIRVVAVANWGPPQPRFVSVAAASRQRQRRSRRRPRAPRPGRRRTTVHGLSERAPDGLARYHPRTHNFIARPR